MFQMNCLGSICGLKPVIHEDIRCESDVSINMAEVSEGERGKKENQSVDGVMR